MSKEFDSVIRDAKQAIDMIESVHEDDLEKQEEEITELQKHIEKLESTIDELLNDEHYCSICGKIVSMKE